MKTLNRGAVAIFASSLLALSALADRGPNRPTPASEAKPAPVTMDSHPSGKCDGCKTTNIWRISDRGPANKGVPGASVTGKNHSCTGCAGTNATETGQTKSDMKHSPACAALVCCK